MKPIHIVAYTLMLACSTLIVWSAWDRGGGYYSTQTRVALFLLPIGLLAISLLCQESLSAAGRTQGWFLAQMHPPVLVGIAIAIWGLAFLQTLPLPQNIASIVAPAGAKIKSEWLPANLLSESDESADAGLDAPPQAVRSVRLSVAPTYTRLALLEPVAFAVMAWVCFLCFRYASTILVFLVVIAGSGTAFSFFGLIDTVRLARDWQVELRQNLTISPVGAGDPFGPFVNNNNASGFLCSGDWLRARPVCSC